MSAEKLVNRSINELITRSAEWVVSSRNRDGGFPSDKEGSPSCTWTTSGLLWASWTAGVGFDAFYMRQALEWVIGQQNDDRGIPIVVRSDSSITDATAQTALACVLALRESEDARFLRALEDCVRWLLYGRLVKGGWNWRASKEPEWVASTAYAVFALHHAQHLGIASGSEIEFALHEALRWLQRTRNRDGGWGSYRGDKSRPAITGLVAATFFEMEVDFDRSAATRLIVSHQTTDGDWVDTIDRPTGHTVTRIGTANCLRALALSGIPLDSRPILEGLKAARGAFDRNRFRYRDTDMLSWPTRDYMLALTAVGSQIGIPKCRTLTNSMTPHKSFPETAPKVTVSPLVPSVDKPRSGRVVLLHISDIHRAVGAPTSNTTLLGKLLDDIEHTYSEDNRRLFDDEPDLTTPDLIVVSGDLTQRGTEADCDEAGRFLESLVQIVGNVRDRVILIPGNHDVNWEISAACYSPSTKRAYDSQPEGTEPYRRAVKLAADGSYWQRDDGRYSERFTPFKNLFDNFYEGSRQFSLDRSRMYTVYDYSAEYGLVLVGLNSCDEIDAYRATDGLLKGLDRRGFINTDALYNASREPAYHVDDRRLVRVAVFHHNIRSVGHGEDFLDPKYLAILQRQGFVLGLHGHVHVANRDVYDPAQDTSLGVVGAGSLAVPYTDRPPAAPMAYNLIIVDQARNEMWIHSRRHDENQLVWTADYRWNGRPCFKVGKCWAVA